MIDTVRFKIPINKAQRDLIILKSIETTKINNKENKTIYKIYNTDLSLGSFDRKINIFLSDTDINNLKMEFSVPKYYFGTNVLLFYIEEDNFRKILYKLYEDLKNYFGDFPIIYKWEIMRLDICYSWKFINNSTAQTILESLRSFCIKRKKLRHYNTSLMNVGATYSIKFYLKKDEFFEHDLKELVSNNRHEFAYNMLNVSDGILRFEVTIRHTHLIRLLEKDFQDGDIIYGVKKVYFNHINDKLIFKWLKYHFNKFFDGRKPKFMDNKEVLNRLLAHFNNKPKLALRLYEFYIVYSRLTKEQQKEYFKMIPYSTFRRLQNQLAEAEIGIDNKEIIKEIEFDIPSQYVVNTANALQGDSLA
jgi:hypothetical protein